MPTRKSNPVELDELLAAEFNYIAQTATQAYDDRVRISSFYMIAVGSLIAAILGAQLFDPEDLKFAVKIIFGGAFLLLTLLGTSTMLQLGRLRAAWHESTTAMNQIKDFAVAQSPELEQAFRWRTDTIPSKLKKGSVSYYQALEVAFISALIFAVACFFLLFAFYEEINLIHFIIPLAGGAVMANIQLRVYKWALG